MRFPVLSEYIQMKTLVSMFKQYHLLSVTVCMRVNQASVGKIRCEENCPNVLKHIPILWRSCKLQTCIPMYLTFSDNTGFELCTLNSTLLCVFIGGECWRSAAGI